MEGKVAHPNSKCPQVPVCSANTNADGSTPDHIRSQKLGEIGTLVAFEGTKKNNSAAVSDDAKAGSHATGIRYTLLEPAPGAPRCALDLRAHRLATQTTPEES